MQIPFKAIPLLGCRHTQDLTPLPRAPVNRKTWPGSALEKTDQLPLPFILLQGRFQQTNSAITFQLLSLDCTPHSDMCPTAQKSGNYDLVYLRISGKNKKAPAAANYDRGNPRLFPDDPALPLTLI